MQIAILLILAIVGAFTVGGSLFRDNDLPQVGGRAPDFALVGLDGKTHRLSDYRGKLVMVNFWGTFCPPCKEEMPAIEKQYQKWRDAGFEVLAVNLAESKVTVDSFVKQLNLTFPILLDDRMEIRKTYGVVNYPTTFLIDQSGKIALKKEGQMDESFIEQNLIKWLGKM
jgi:peroxiredoxin